MRHRQQNRLRADAFDGHTELPSPHLVARDPDVASNDEIERMLRRAFAPHRCEVEFQDDGRKVALKLSAVDGREFFVEAKRVELLRSRHMLLQYVRDVKACLTGRNVAFHRPHASPRE